VEDLKKYRELLKKIHAYEYVLTVIGWDSQTEAPRDSFKRRAEMMGIIGSELFKLSTGEETIALVNRLVDNKEELDERTKRELHFFKKDIDRFVKIPEVDFVEYQKLVQIATHEWEDAKANNDYELFKPYLKQIIDYQKKFISYYEIDDLPYNVLLDDYEEGMSMKEYDAFFALLEKELVPFAKEIFAVKTERNDAFVSKFFDAKKQQLFSEYLMDVMYFNKNRGLMKKSVHPFTWNTSPEDVRFTTRYLENYFLSSIFASVHELGHATYEQQVSTELDDTNLRGGTSMGIHESQSRFFENMIGRSLEFWQAHYPKLQEIFAEELKDVSLEDFYLAINKVEASLIRIEADELTYSLHIMLRYQIEKEIFNGNLDVDTLPERWNELSEKYLGIRPETNAEGILQDVHWSSGMFGYFPTYALGSAYAAQFYQAMAKDIDINTLVKENNIKEINAWLKEKIHQYGKTKSPAELLLSVTGEAFDAKYYIEYLISKYSKIYGIER